MNIKLGSYYNHEKNEFEDVGIEWESKEQFVKFLDDVEGDQSIIAQFEVDDLIVLGIMLEKQKDLFIKEDL